jgi:hypothetical protein
MNGYHYIPTDVVAVREITDGIWMTLSFFLTFLFAHYFCKYSKIRPWDLAIKAAFALFLLCLSISIRSTVFWIQWKSYQMYGEFLFWWGNTVIFSISSFLSIVAALLCIHIFYPDIHRTFVQMLTGVFIIGVPVVLYYLF